MSDRFIRIQELEKITGLSRSTIWRKEKAGTFPKRRKISTNSVAWLESEITFWMFELSDKMGDWPEDLKKTKENSYLYMLDTLRHLSILNGNTMADLETTLMGKMGLTKAKAKSDIDKAQRIFSP